MRDLVTFYRNRVHLFSEKDNWCRALKNCYLDKPVDEALIYSLLDECRDPSIKNPRDYLHYLRKLLSLSFIYKFQQGSMLVAPLQKIYQEIYTKGFWKEFQLGEGLYVLGCNLVGLPTSSIEPKQFAKGGVLIEAGNHLLDGGVPHPLLNAELALVWIFLGWETENEMLIHSALKWAHLSMGLFDHEYRPFHGVWVRDSEYHPVSVFILYFLLFSVSSELVVNSKMLHLSESLFEALKKEEEVLLQTPPIFLSFFALGFKHLYNKKKFPETQNFYSMNELDESLAYLSTKQNDISLVCSFIGVNTGLGALHKTHLQVVSFGPHFTPLADSNRYGLHRTSSGTSEAFSDLEFNKKIDTFEIKGWSRLISPYISPDCYQNMTLVQPGNQWLFFSALGDGDKIFFETSLSEHDEKYPLYFAYFIIADQALIEGEESLKPATLKKYQGISKSVVFEKGKEKLNIDPQIETEMHLIPLAGHPHFWAADFLVAYLFKEDQQVYSWEIS